MGSIDELHAFVDMDCTALSYDGSTVWAAPRALRAHSFGYNVLPPAWLLFRDPAGCRHVPIRVMKYAQRGFGSLLCQRFRHTPRCDVQLSAPAKNMMKAIHILQETPSNVSKLV